MFLQRRRAAGKSSAGPDEIAERVNRPVGLAKELWPGVQVVRTKITDETKLIRAKSLPVSLDPLCRLFDQLQITTRLLPRLCARQLVHQDDLRPERRHHLRAFRRITFRHQRHEWIPLDAADNRQPGPGIATGQLQNSLSRFQTPVGFGIGDDLPGNSIFFSTSPD